MSVAIGPIKLLLNGVERYGMEWSMKCDETLGGVGRATLLLQDRTNSLEPEPHWEVKLVIRSGPFANWVLWRGEILNEGIKLILHKPWRSWDLQCVDYNDQRKQRLVGAFDGKTWADRGFGIYVNIDPNAESLETDKLTVQNLFDKYIRINGEAFDTTTYVQQYIDDLFPISWAYSNLQTALEEMAAQVVDNLQFWSDPDLKFHWVTIPAWQDLAQGLVAVSEDPTASLTAMGFPEGTLNGMDFAPYEVVDTRTGDELAAGEVGFFDLSIEYDGGAMPEQIYVKGGTSYVYNAPPIPPADETKTVVKAPTPGVPGTYELTFLATTKLWHTDGTGYISLDYDTVGPSGPYNVKYVQVPWNEARHKGGGFWKLLNGPNAGKLVDNDTNVLSGYGEIEVVRITTTPGDPDDPKVGVGGTGWVGEVDQDLNKRQAYLDLPIATTRALRDQHGGQALYRGQTPTLRGQVKVRGKDGWRVGQLMKVTDSRLPAALNGKYFVIQRVASSLVSGNDLRQYDIDFGDGPKSRWSAQFRGGPVRWPPGATAIFVEAHDLSPGPNSTQIITGQLVNGAGEPWKIKGKVVDWSLEAYDNIGTQIFGQGVVKPTVSITDENGKARTKFTSGSQTGLVYFIFAKVTVT